MAALKAELKQLKAAESAVAGASPENTSGSVQPSAPTKRTIKDMILGALDDFPHGARAEQIVLKIQEKFGEEIARSSMSPQLTRLKNDNLVVRENNLWTNYEFATKRVVGVSNPAPAPVSNNVGADRQSLPPMGGNQPVPLARMAAAPPHPQTFQPTAPPPLGKGGLPLMPNRST